MRGPLRKFCQTKECHPVTVDCPPVHHHDHYHQHHYHYQVVRMQMMFIIIPVLTRSQVPRLLAP